jgi:hypothetical protein
MTLFLLLTVAGLLMAAASYMATPLIDDIETLTNPDLTAAGRLAEQRLELGKAIRELRMRLSMTVNVTVLGAPVYHEDAPWNYISVVEILRNGRDVLARISGASLRLLARHERKTDPASSLPTLGGGNNTITADLTLPFYPMDGLEPDAWALDARDPRIKNLQVRVQFAGPAAIFSTAPTAHTVTAATVSVSQESYADDFAFPMGPFVARLYETSDALATAATLDRRVPQGNFPPGGAIDSFLFIARDGATPVRNDALITRLRWRHAGTTKINIPWLTLRDAYKTDRQLETLPTGVAKYDVDKERDGRHWVPTMNVLDHRWDVDQIAGTGSPSLTIVRREVFIPAGAR